MKKLAIILAAAMLLMLCACSVEEVDLSASVAPEVNEQTETQTQPDYIFDADGVEIVMHADAQPILDSLGEPQGYFEEPSCATDDIDKVYMYQSLQLWVYPDGDGYRVYSLVLLNDTVSTPEGVAIGDSADEVTEVYGDDYREDGIIRVYSTHNTELRFTVEEGIVTAISYTAVLD